MLSPATRRILLGLNNGKCVSGRAVSVRQQCFSHLRQTSLSSNLYPTSYLISQSQCWLSFIFLNKKETSSTTVNADGIYKTTLSGPSGVKNDISMLKSK